MEAHCRSADSVFRLKPPHQCLHSRRYPHRCQWTETQKMSLQNAHERQIEVLHLFSQNEIKSVRWVCHYAISEAINHAHTHADLHAPLPSLTFCWADTVWALRLTLQYVEWAHMLVGRAKTNGCNGFSNISWAFQCPKGGTGLVLNNAHS